MKTNGLAATALAPRAEETARSPARASLRRDKFSTLHLACFAPAKKTPATAE